MKKWFVQFKFELSFLFKNWLLLPLPLLFSIWLVISLTADRVGSSENIYRSFYQTTHSTIFILVVGLSIVIGVYLMRRDIGNESFEWHRAFPVSNFVFLSTKFAAGMIYISLFTLVMASIFSILSIYQSIPDKEITNVLSFYVIQYEVSLLISLSLGMILSVIIQNRFVYLIAFCAWIFGTLFMEIYIIDGTSNFYLKPFHLTYLFTDSVLVNGSWGIEIMKEEIKKQRLFVLTFSAMLLTMTILLLNSRRPNEYHKLWKVLGIASVLITTFAYIPYGLFWNERLTAFNNVKEVAPTFSYPREDQPTIYMTLPPLPHPEALPEEERTVYEQNRFVIDDYNITLNQEPGNLLRVKANVTIPKEQLLSKEKLDFTLNNSFSIKEVKIDQQNISFKQENNFVSVTLPNNLQASTIQFTYDGVYNLWTHRHDQEYYPGFFLNDQIVMPAHTAWYPLPGHQYLLDSTGVSRVDVGLLQPADFTVTVKGIKNKVFGSIKNVSTSGEIHTLTGETARLDLYSGLLSEIESKRYETTLVTVPYRRNAASTFINEVDDRLFYFEEFLNEDIDPVHHFFFFPLDRMRWSGYYTQEGFMDQNYLVGDMTYFNTQNFVNDFVKVNLFHEDNHLSGNSRPENLLITHTIKAAFNYVYELEHGREEDALNTRSAYANIPDDAVKHNYSNEILESDKVLDMIEKAMKQGKEAKVKEVLSNLYSTHWSNNSYPTGYDLYQEPAAIISFEEWKKEWDNVMEN